MAISKESGKAKLLSELFDTKTVKVLQNLLLKKDIFYLRDISRETNVSLATTFRIIQKLHKLGIVDKKHEYKFTVYTVNTENQLYEDIKDLVLGKSLNPIDLLKSMLAEKYGDKFELYATKGKDKKLFLVSEQINQTHIKEITDQVKQETQASLSCLALIPMQFESVKEAMGLKDLQVV